MIGLTNNKMTNMMDLIYSSIASKYTFDRKKDDDGRFSFETYDEFVTFNKNCINEQTDESKIWLYKLCQMIKGGKINLVDEESCVEFEADTFYFNMKKQICIVNPR
jgi:hypothetical protein